MTIADSEGLRAQVASLLMFAGMKPVSDKLIRDIIAAVEREQGEAFECMGQGRLRLIRAGAKETFDGQ